MSLRIAVIGAGRLGGFHAQKLARMANVELVGVVDPLAANRDRLAAELHTAAFASHLPLLGRIDAAVIASPTVLHHRVGRRSSGSRHAPAHREAHLHDRGRGR